MWAFFDSLSSGYMPHGGCYLWDPTLLWTHVLSDAVIGLSYFSIPLALIYFVHRRKDMAFGWMFVMFASFILFCGASHLMQIWTTWQPFYWTEGFVKVATAVVSAWTAVALWPMLPQAIALPSHRELQGEVKRRKEVEQELRKTNKTLEQKVQKRTEQLEQFIYAASHDLREPARVMKTYAEFIEEDLEHEQLTEDVQEDLGFIKDSSTHMIELIDSLLELSRTSRREPEFETVDVNDCVDQAMNQLKQPISGCDVTFERDSLPQLQADPRLLSDLYQNLISNALKYGGDGEVFIRFTAQQVDGDWVLGVKDNGIGIKSKHQDQIFDPFESLHSKADDSGTGIGLSICQRIVAHHGGEIWVESSPGEGSHVKFNLPGEPDGKA